MLDTDGRARGSHPVTRILLLGRDGGLLAVGAMVAGG